MEVIIRFSRSTSDVAQSLATLGNALEEFRKEQMEFWDEENQRISNDIANATRDEAIVRQLSIEDNERLTQARVNLALLKQQQDQIGYDFRDVIKPEFQELTRKIRQEQANIEKLKQETKVLKAEVQAQISEIRKATILISTLLGFLSLVQAVAGRIEDQLMFTVLNIAQATISFFALYGTLGAASGNWALLAAAGAGAASAASVINTVRLIGSRAGQKNEEIRRRNQLRKVE